MRRRAEKEESIRGGQRPRGEGNGPPRRASDEADEGTRTRHEAEGAEEESRTTE